MPSIKIPTPLRTYTGGQTEVALEGTTVSDAMQDLVVKYPALKPHLFNGEGDLRPFVNLFLDGNNIREMQGVQTPLQAGDRLLLIPSIAGGFQASFKLS